MLLLSMFLKLLIILCIPPICFIVGKCDTVDPTEQMICPTWMYPNTSSSQHECVCSSTLKGIVRCNNNSYLIIKGNYCLFFSKEMNDTFIGSCPYWYGGRVSNNASQLKGNNSIACSPSMHRKGQLCGECEDNYNFPVYTYSLSCVKCKNFKYGWIKFIVAAFFPLTAFYVFVIVFRISTTSSALNGFILVSRIVTTPTVINYVYSSNQKSQVEYSLQFVVNLFTPFGTLTSFDHFTSPSAFN